jgi:hypothetical protein
MFGKKKRQFAAQTINSKFGLMNGVRDAISQSVYFEDNQHAQGKRALEQFVNRIESTDNIIFITVNSLSPALRLRAENLVPSLLSTLTYNAPGMASPAYYAGNEICRELFGLDPFIEEESDLVAADVAVTSGLMRFAGSQVAFGLSEESAQTVVVGVTLAAGWLESSERAQLK